MKHFSKGQKNTMIYIYIYVNVNRYSWGQSDILEDECHFGFSLSTKDLDKDPNFTLKMKGNIAMN